MEKLILLCLLCSLNVYSKTNPWNNLEFSTGMHTIVAESSVTKARIFGFTFGVDFDYPLAKDLNFFLQSSAVLQTGSNEVFGTIAEFSPNEAIFLRGGGVSYQAADWLNLKLGAINQRVYNSPLLLSNSGYVAFAGSHEELKFGNYYLRFQQSIPSNNYLARRLGTVETGTPFFDMETFGFKFGAKNKIRLELSHYKYKDLSNGVAQKSLSIGNSTKGSGTGIEFLYDFEGMNLFVDSSFVFWGKQFLLGGQYLYNDKAPEGRNKGVLAFAGVRGNTYGLKFEGFRNESDSSVAFYNSKYYGHNNMYGQAILLEYHSRGMLAEFRLTDMKPIEENFIQDDTVIVQFNISQVLDL